MRDIRHRVGINAPTEKVFAALSSIDGLRRWWISSATGDAVQDGVIDFGFCKMHVVALVPNELVRWKCQSGPSEWVGTEVVFALKWERAQSFVLFTHAGWKDPVEFMHHCSTKWATFLLSLMEYVERGSGRPQPNDLKIHVGD